MAEFYRSLPPVVKFYGTACLVTTVAALLKVIDPVYLSFDPELVFKQLQLWRVVTNFFFLGQVQLMMLARYGAQLEKSMQTAQFVWMLILAALTLVVLAVAIPGLNFMGPTIFFMLMYLWSREFPTARVSILGCLTMQGCYLPWAMLLVGGSVVWNFMGIVLGHVYYFLARTGAKDYLQAPGFLQKLLTKWGIGDVRQGGSVHQQPQQPPTSPPST